MQLNSSLYVYKIKKNSFTFLLGWIEHTVVDVIAMLTRSVSAEQVIQFNPLVCKKHSALWHTDSKIKPFFYLYDYNRFELICLVITMVTESRFVSSSVCRDLWQRLNHNACISNFNNNEFLGWFAAITVCTSLGGDVVRSVRLLQYDMYIYVCKRFHMSFSTVMSTSLWNLTSFKTFTFISHYQQ